MHSKPTPYCLQQGSQAEISADSEPHKEHQDPYLPLFYRAGDELCVVCEPVYPGAFVRLALEYLSAQETPSPDGV